MASTAELQSYATTQANAYGIPPSIFANLINTESGWNPGAIGAAGEEGIAQLKPGTAPEINRFDPFASLSKSAQLLRGYFDRFGSWPLAVAAYNAGPNNKTIQAGGIPNSGYVGKVLGLSVGSGTMDMQGSFKILFWAAAAIIAIIVIGSVSK